ncbi:hypothetical protein pb186bvf_004317 [Paramecium bursaria]
MFLFLIVHVYGYGYTIMDGPVEQIIWCGVANESFVLTAKGTIYKNYQLEQKKFTDKLENFTVMEILQSPANNSVLFIIGDHKTSFYTVNCGKNYTQINHDRGFYDFKLNHMNQSQMIAFKDVKCNTSLPLCKEKYKKELYYSEDYGASWTLALQRVRDADWDKLLESPLIPDTRIIVAHLLQNESVVVCYSDDFFRSNKTIRMNSHGYYQTNEYLFALIDADAQSKGYDLEVTKAYQFNLTEVVLPVEDHQKYTFTVLDTVDGSIFVSVSHLEEFPKVTNIYKSDQDGNNYALSLMNNVRSLDSGRCDFEPLINGAYIANVFDQEEYEKMKTRRTSKNFEAQQKLDKYKQTRITFDRGGEWHPIKSPKYDFRGQPIGCGGDCSLNLLGRSEAFRNSIVTRNHLVIGTGSTGVYINDQFNTYLSRDGGHTWFEILEGLYVYEIGGDTGVIVFVVDEEKATQLLYTWDEGLTFKALKLNVTLDISSIVFSGDRFLIYGIQDAKQLLEIDDITQSSLRGVMLNVNIRDIAVRECKGYDEPGDDDSDYEYWSPTNYAGERCIYGQRLKQIRRKRNAACFNAQKYQFQSIETCPCTQEDWECDVGYYRNIENKCVAMKEQKKIHCSGTYMKSQGYRKVTGDKCVGGIDLGPISTKCSEDDMITDKNVDRKQNDVKVEQPQDVDIINWFQEEKKGGIKYGYLIVGLIMLLGAIYLKKKLLGQR